MPLGENPTRLNAERNTGGPFPASASGERPRFQFRYDKYGVGSLFTPGVRYQIFNLNVDPALIYRKFYFAVNIPAVTIFQCLSPQSWIRFSIANSVIEEWPFNCNMNTDNYTEKVNAPLPSWNVKHLDSAAGFGPQNIEMDCASDTLLAFTNATGGGFTNFYKIVMYPLKLVAEMDTITMQLMTPVGLSLSNPPNIEFWIACLSQNLPY